MSRSGKREFTRKEARQICDAATANVLVKAVLDPNLSGKFRLKQSLTYFTALNYCSAYTEEEAGHAITKGVAARAECNVRGAFGASADALIALVQESVAEAMQNVRAAKAGGKSAGGGGVGSPP